MRRKSYVLEDTFADEVKPDLPGREEQVWDAGNRKLQSLIQRGENGPQGIASVASPVGYEAELFEVSGHSSQVNTMDEEWKGWQGGKHRGSVSATVKGAILQFKR